MNIKNILLIIIIIYLVISHSKIYKKNNIEKFAVTDDIRAVVKEIYNTDMEAVRQLAAMATKLNAGGLEIPGNLIVTGSITNSGNISTTGNLSGNNITSNNNVFNLLPTGIILAYNSTSAPAGWILCDGTKGTPDLRGRFILGTGQGSGLTNRIINNTGGAETHTLTVTEMPTHSHGFSARPFSNGGGGDWFMSRGWSYEGIEDTKHNTKIHDAGGGGSHNNMPPFYVLTYIMKT